MACRAFLLAASASAPADLRAGHRWVSPCCSDQDKIASRQVFWSGLKVHGVVSTNVNVCKCTVVINQNSHFSVGKKCFPSPSWLHNQNQDRLSSTAMEHLPFDSLVDGVPMKYKYVDIPSQCSIRGGHVIHGFEELASAGSHLVLAPDSSRPQQKWSRYSFGAWNPERMANK